MEHQATSGAVFGCHNWEEQCCWCLVGRGRRSCSASCTAQDRPPRRGLAQPQISKLGGEAPTRRAYPRRRARRFGLCCSQAAGGGRKTQGLPPTQQSVLFAWHPVSWGCPRGEHWGDGKPAPSLRERRGAGGGAHTAGVT